MTDRPQRQFDVQPVRIGSYTKYHTTVLCSECGFEKVFENNKNLPDEVISKKFKQWGWLLGRKRAHDVCPRCLGISAENKLANRFKVKIGSEEVPTPLDVVEDLEKERSSKRKKVAEALDRHFNLNKETKAKDVPIVPPADTQGLGTAIVSMASDMKAIRREMGQVSAALELVLEQLTNISAQGAQQIEAISRIAPIMARGSDAMAVGIATASRSIERLSSLLENQSKIPEGQNTSPPDEVSKPEPFVGIVPAATISSFLVNKQWPDKFKTEFRIERSVWLRTGFPLDGSFKCEKSGQWFVITQADGDNGERGVKIYRASSRSVVLRFGTLGNINMKSVHVLSSIGRLMIGSAPAEKSKKRRKSLIELSPVH